MAVRIRLSKIGKKNAPAFKIVAATKRDKLTGKYLDELGHFNPSHDPVLFEIDKKKYKEWLAKGAKPSKAVEELVEGKYEFQHYTRQNEVDEKAEAEAKEKAKAETEVETEEVIEEEIEEEEKVEEQEAKEEADK